MVNACSRSCTTICAYIPVSVSDGSLAVPLRTFRSSLSPSRPAGSTTCDSSPTAFFDIYFTSCNMFDCISNFMAFFR